MAINFYNIWVDQVGKMFSKGDGNKPCQDLQSEILRRNSTKTSNFRTRTSIQSIFLFVAPFWFVCVLLATAYIQCLHEHRNNKGSVLDNLREDDTRIASIADKLYSTPAPGIDNGVGAWI